MNASPTPKRKSLSRLSKTHLTVGITLNYLSARKWTVAEDRRDIWACRIPLWRTAAWTSRPGRGSRELQFEHLNPTSELTPGQSYVLYLSATGDFDKSAARVKGPRPAGVDVCAVVIMEHPDKVSTLQLGATQSENQQAARCGVISTIRNDLFLDLLLHFFLPVCKFLLGPRAQASESNHKHSNTQRFSHHILFACIQQPSWVPLRC